MNGGVATLRRDPSLCDRRLRNAESPCSSGFTVMSAAVAKLRILTLHRHLRAKSPSQPRGLLRTGAHVHWPVQLDTGAPDVVELPIEELALALIRVDGGRFVRSGSGRPQNQWTATEEAEH